MWPVLLCKLPFISVGLQCAGELQWVGEGVMLELLYSKEMHSLEFYMHNFALKAFLNYPQMLSDCIPFFCLLLIYVLAATS